MILRALNRKMTPEDFRNAKAEGLLIPTLTAYDYPSAKLMDEVGVPLLLVGDSLGMVRLGFPDTTHVTLDHMVLHTQSVTRAKPRSLIIADLPFGTYTDPVLAVSSAKRLMEAGADAVKAEGGKSIEDSVRAIVQAGIPFVGHLGMLPQSVKQEGGYRKKGRTQEERVRLLEDMRILEEAGAFAVVLELVIPDLAEDMTCSSEIPTIGIGSGAACDGQVLVIDDLVGSFPWFTPKFVKPLAQTGLAIQNAVREWMEVLDVGKAELDSAAEDKSDSLTHIDADGEARMVDVSAKPPQYRVAVAGGRLRVQPFVLDLIENQKIAKGNVLATARIAGIMAAKRTGDLIPLCHPLPITHCDVNLGFSPAREAIEVTASASIHASTGVEMEALTAVQVALLTLYDMLKAVDKNMVIEEVKLLSKTKSAAPPVK